MSDRVHYKHESEHRILCARVPNYNSATNYAPEVTCKWCLKVLHGPQRDLALAIKASEPRS